MKVFLGGTCNGSKWRDKIINLLEIDYFNPVVDDWNIEAQQRELHERETCDFVLYCITPKMVGVYAIAEVVDDSNKRPDKTIFCVLQEDGGLFWGHDQWKSLVAVANMVVRNGGVFFESLEETSKYLNHFSRSFKKG